jgi:polyisoprenoid-binding protein YceI
MILRPLAAALAALLLAVPAWAGDWAVLPADSSLTLTIQQGQTPIKARFERFDADISFDPADPGQARIVVEVDLASFASDDDQRDAQAKGPDFLAAGDGARAVYRTTSVTPIGGDRYRVEAELTLKGVTRQVSHEATITVDGDAAHAVGLVPITRTEFGVGTGQFATGGLIGLDVAVAFDLEAKAK